MAVSVLWYILQEAVELYLYSNLILVIGLSEVKFRVYNRVSDFKIVLGQSEIGLITVFDAILTGRQSAQKLQCLYGNPIANNFFQN